MIDYEFVGENRNGLDVIEQYGIAQQSILVTSRFGEKAIQMRAEAMGTKILPKNIAALVEIRREGRKFEYDAVVVDNDTLVHSMWELVAREKGKKIICFASIDGFKQAENQIDRNSPIYVDVDLGNQIRGEDIAVQISEMGFRDVSLATGHSKESIIIPGCVRRVIGKDPFFEELGKA